MYRTSSRGIWVVGLFFLWVVSPCRQVAFCCGEEAGEQVPKIKEEDLPSIPEFGTEKARELDRALLRLWMRDLEHYVRLTKDPAEIRPQAVRFMRLVQATMLPIPRVMTKQSLAAIGDELVQKGSQDPLVKSYRAWVLLSSTAEIEHAAELVVEVLQEWQESGYPIEAQRVAITSMARLLEELPGWLDPLSRLRSPSVESCFQSYLTARFEDTTIPEEFERALLFEFERICGNLTINSLLTNRLQSTLLQLRVRNPSSWLRLMIEAKISLRFAWAARGNDFAHKVPPESWRTFYGRSDFAAEKLQEAIGLCPSHPEAFAEMLSISMSTGKYGTPREWFEKARAAQFDYLPAYDQYLTSLLPRWGGSLEEMLEFGKECAASQRHDTNIPLYYLHVVRKINAEMGRTHKIWTAPGVFDTAMEVLSAAEKNSLRSAEIAVSPTARSCATAKAMITMLASRYDEFRLIYESLNGQLDSREMRRWFWQPEFALAKALALTSPAKAAIEEIRAALAADDEKPSPEQLMKARELCDEAIAGADSPLAKAFCNFVAEVVQQRLAYHSGEWVELRFDEQLFWLEPVVGQWERENETTVIVRTQPGIDLAWAQLRDTPRPPIELEMEIEYEPRRGAYDKFGVGLWPPEHVAEGRILYRFAIEYFSNQALIQLGDAMQRVPAELTERNRLKVQLADRLAVLWVNGKRCVEMRDPEFLPRGNYVFGTYSFLSSDRTFRISNVRYRKWVQDSTEEEPRAQ